MDKIKEIYVEAVGLEEYLVLNVQGMKIYTKAELDAHIYNLANEGNIVILSRLDHYPKPGHA